MRRADRTTFGRSVFEQLKDVRLRPTLMVVLYGLQHHETTQAFIRALEFLAPSVQSVQAMRAHIVFTSFEKRWQLPVYFQLRWKEIVAKLEDALATTKLERNKGV